MEKINLEKLADKTRLIKNKLKENPNNLSANNKLEEYKKIGYSEEVKDAAVAEYKNFEIKRKDLISQIENAHNEEDRSKPLVELNRLDAEYFNGELFADKNILKKMKEEDKFDDNYEDFDKLPENLPVPQDIKEIKITEVIYESDLVDGQKFFTKNEAFGLACKNAKNRKDGLIWFENAEDLYCINVEKNGFNIEVLPYVSDRNWADGVSFFKE